MSFDFDTWKRSSRPLEAILIFSKGNKKVYLNSIQIVICVSFELRKLIILILFHGVRCGMHRKE